MERIVKTAPRESNGVFAKETTKKWKDFGCGKTSHISDYDPFVVVYPKKTLSKPKGARPSIVLRKSTPRRSETSSYKGRQSQSELDMCKVDPMIDAIWSDLTDRHARLIRAGIGRGSEDKVKQIKTRYIQQILRVLLSTVGVKPVSKPEARRSIPAYVMHRELIKQQMEWLATKKVAKKLQLVRELLQHKNMPQSTEDQRMQEEYGESSQQYIGLLKFFNKEMPEDQRQSQMDIMAKTFDSIIEQLNDNVTGTNKLTPIQSLYNQSEPGHDLQSEWKTQITRKSIEATRAEWMQYFADLPKTPFEQKRSAIRLQRKKALIAQKKDLKQIKREQRKRELIGCRPLTELYTNPRLTHRMQQVLAERAEQARRQATQQSESQSQPQSLVQVHPKTKPKTKSCSKGLKMADAVLKAIQEHDSCCKCQLFPTRIKRF